MNLKDLVGKTIEDVHEVADNCWHVEFSDGTEVEIEADTVYVAGGNLPVISLTNLRDFS
jgi:pyruvate/2-oxoglutarate dehydrogenase complex dihydrolipoamide dehydrogenase (E3) component